MNKGTFALYSITASGREATITNILKDAGVPVSTIQKHDKALTVPRMTTYWRGDAEEKSWQEAIRKNVHEADPSASIIIEANEWSLAPGYPQGDVDL